MVVCHHRCCCGIDGFGKSARLFQRYAPSRSAPGRSPQRGGGNLPTPLASNSTRPADASCFNAGTPKAFSASSNPSPAPRPSRSNAGWPGWATNASRKLKTRNSPPNAPAPSTKPRATPTTGSRNGYPIFVLSVLFCSSRFSIRHFAFFILHSAFSLKPALTKIRTYG